MPNDVPLRARNYYPGKVLVSGEVNDKAVRRTHVDMRGVLKRLAEEPARTAVMHAQRG